MIEKLVLFVSLCVMARGDAECLQRDYGNTGTVCVCNADHCDTVGPVEELDPGQYVIYTSNLDGLRFSKQTEVFEEAQTRDDEAIVNIDHSITYQTIHGFGGAFTDSAGININSLDEQARKYLLRSYFSDEGLEYNIGRVPIGGTDFSTHSYSYLDTEEPDLDLANFALQPEDFIYKIPLIHEAKELSGNKLSLFASAWTAPRWMKTNSEQAGAGFLKTEMYQLWVDYFIKFLDSYKEQGINFWGITTGNEPSLALFAFMGINSVGWWPWTQNTWISENFGPTLRNSEYSDLKLIAHDDQTILLPLLNILFSDAKAREYVDGIGVHWYWNDFIPMSWLTNVHNKYPEKFILGTEACKGDRPWDTAVLLGSWQRGQAYATDIILDLQNWAVGWVDWNLALDTTGGPTFIDNNVDAAIIVNATGGEFYKQPIYYALGHFSKFIPRDSVRVETSNESNDVLIVAFDRPDNGTVVVIVNNQDTSRSITLSDERRGTITREITAKSFNTLLYW